MEDDVMTQAEAARLLGVSRARVGQMVDAGLLPAVERTVTVRYVRRADVEALARQSRPPGRHRPPETAPDQDRPS